MCQNLIPPLNFGLVEENLYRSGEPNNLNFPFLEKLKLKKIIYLATELPKKELLIFAEDNDISLHHLSEDPSHNTSSWPMSEEVVLNAIQIVLQPDNYPLIIMCNLGRHRTGTLVGCLRKLQRWNLTSIFEEYRRFAGPKCATAARILNL
ncbi:probable tyrosine-protein phosphatase DG1060 isoform X2 [Zophobas morio]|uniref:probable tyrosine-protein phosphatase DG1060 isoform X2 n=1 Tax=Zophobas morio TaxID=2755281 RepID=UPI00308396BE